MIPKQIMFTASVPIFKFVTFWDVEKQTNVVNNFSTMI